MPRGGCLAGQGRQRPELVVSLDQHRAPTPRATILPDYSRGSDAAEAFPSAPHRPQDVEAKSTSLVSTVPAVRPGAVW